MLAQSEKRWKLMLRFHWKCLCAKRKEAMQGGKWETLEEGAHAHGGGRVLNGRRWKSYTKIGWKESTHGQRWAAARRGASWDSVQWLHFLRRQASKSAAQSNEGSGKEVRSPGVIPLGNGQRNWAGMYCRLSSADCLTAIRLCSFSWVVWCSPNTERKIKG